MLLQDAAAVYRNGLKAGSQCSLKTSALCYELVIGHRGYLELYGSAGPRGRRAGLHEVSRGAHFFKCCLTFSSCRLR